MSKYRLTITSRCGQRETAVSGDSVQECINKLEDYHTFGKFEKEFFSEKGEERLKEELESGWYIKNDNENNK